MILGLPVQGKISNPTHAILCHLCWSLAGNHSFVKTFSFPFQSLTSPQIIIQKFPMTGSFGNHQCVGKTRTPLTHQGIAQSEKPVYSAFASQSQRGCGDPARGDA